MARTAASPAATSSAFMRNTENATSSGMVSRTISAPTMTPLKSTGIRNDRNGKPFTVTLRNRYEQVAASAVAAAPTITSIGPRVLVRFERIQPMIRPGIATGVNTGIMVSASEMRN